MPQRGGKILDDIVRVRIVIMRPDLELALAHPGREHAPMRGVWGKVRLGFLILVGSFGCEHGRAFLRRVRRDGSQPEQCWHCPSDTLSKPALYPVDHGFARDC